tara:strand:+ start:1980 stop:2912 length:933 start_codon:yes stop_codon:yes gene_type:complete
MKNILVTGAAGFVGSHLITKLISQGNSVIGIDNLGLGSISNIENSLEENNFRFYELDILNDSFKNIISNYKFDEVYHLAANSDIKAGSQDVTRDLNLTFLSTFEVLRYLSKLGTKKYFFSSTSAIFGDLGEMKIDENSAPLKPQSFYGAAKLSSEAYLSAFSHMFDLDICILRFPNVLGANLTHGVVYDFIQKLKENKTVLHILGNGKQRKPYIHISDLLAAIEIGMQQNDKFGVYNVCSDGQTSVDEIANIVCEEMGLSDVKYEYSGQNIGWKGDVPIYDYNTEKIRQKGWSPRMNSNQTVRKTVQENL